MTIQDFILLFILCVAGMIALLFAAEARSNKSLIPYLLWVTVAALCLIVAGRLL